MTTPSIPLILTIRPEGLWDRQASVDHFSRLRDLLAQQRRIHGRARVLVDFSALLVQPQETVGQMRAGLLASYRPEDRVALVGGGALLHMQIKRMASLAETMMFTEMGDAEAWLKQE